MFRVRASPAARDGRIEILHNHLVRSFPFPSTTNLCLVIQALDLLGQFVHPASKTRPRIKHRLVNYVATSMFPTLNQLKQGGSI